MTELQQKRADSPPLEGIRRTSPFILTRAADDEAGDGFTLDGYGAVFNRETIIDSWEGRFKEKIAPGAMKKSFRETPPLVQFDHGHHPLIGSIPIASVESISEEVDPVRAPEGGAHIIARMVDNWLVEPVRDAIANGSINGMSFRFSVVQEEWHDHAGKKITDEADLRSLLRQTWDDSFPDDELPVRTLKQLKVPEIGPVVWPAYSDTSVGVRSEGDQILHIDLRGLDKLSERSKLARAIFVADRAEAREQEPQQITEDNSAGEHGERSDDAQPITARRVAETHESASKRLARESALAAGRATLQSLERGHRHD